MKKRVLFILIGLLMNATLVACGPSPVEHDAQVTEITAHAFVTQTAEAPPPMPRPTPSATPTSPVISVLPTTGAVRGVLVDKSTGQLASDVRVALGLVEYGQDGKPTGYKIEAQEGKPLYSAYTDTTGVFLIEAQPGTYVLVSPGGSSLDEIARDDSGTALLIQVEAGRTVDVGGIRVSMGISTSVPPPATSTLSPTPSSKALVPVSLEHPVVLTDGYLKITVSAITNLGDRVVGKAGVNTESISVRPEYSDSHGLLALTVLVEKATDQEWGFGTLCFAGDSVAQMGWAGQGCLSMEDGSGHRLECAGAGYATPFGAPSEVFWHSGFFIPVKSPSPEEMYLAFVVADELEQFTLTLETVLAKP